MVMMSKEWIQEAMEISSVVARQVHRRYSVYFDAADLQQELIEWCLKHERKVKEWLNPELELADRKGNIKQLAKSLNREADKYCRHRKAKSCGYETRDEVFYTPSMLEELITHMDELENVSNSASGNVRVSNGGSDPATSNNYLASIIDVRGALEKLDPTDQILIEMKFQENLTLGQIAVLVELSDTTISRRIHNALRKMSQSLGGESPWGGPGSKRVVSNQQAQSMLE
jgi:RNA polymerase sigma factor (sigma-70 family)